MLYLHSESLGRCILCIIPNIISKDQLEFDINLVEREGKRLESGLSELKNFNLPGLVTNELETLQSNLQEDSESQMFNSLPPRLYNVYEQQQLPLTLPNIHESINHETSSMLPANTLV